MKKIKAEYEEKNNRVETVEAHVTSLRKQAADLLLEYDRLLEDNQNLHAQALRQKVWEKDWVTLMNQVLTKIYHWDHH